MNKTYYVCKYTPIELLEAFGGECQNLNEMPQGFDHADQIAHPNICGFGKALLEAVMSGKVKELVLVNCCDTIRSVYDILEDSGKLDFLYMIDMLHCDGECSRERTVLQLKGLARAYGAYKGSEFDQKKFVEAFKEPEKQKEPYISVLGARMGNELYEMVKESMPYSVENDTCVNNRSVGEVKPPKTDDFNELKESALSLIKRLDDIDLYEMGEAIKQISDYKLQVQDYFDLITVWYRDVLYMKATNDVNGLIFKDEVYDIKKQASKHSYHGIETIIEALDKAKLRINANVNFDLVIELLLMTIKEN